MTHKLFNLEIVTPHSSEHVKIYWIEIESPTGSFLVGPNHTPLVSIIKKKSKLLYKAHDDKEYAIDAYGGMFKIIENKALVLLDQ